jgi:hypothetical protein
MNSRRRVNFSDIGARDENGYKDRSKDINSRLVSAGSDFIFTGIEGENGVIEGLEWNSPRMELIRILISTYHKSFVSPEGKVSSKEEMLEDKFNRVARMAKGDSSYSEVKKVQLSGVDGVFKALRVDFGDNAVGVRKGITWTAYRFYQGKPQELEININASPQFETLIRMIFDTIEIEQDKAVG